MDLGFGLFLLIAFLAVVLLLEGLYLLWNDTRSPEVQRFARRLRAVSAGSHGHQALNLLKERGLNDAKWLDRLLLQVPRIGAIDRMLVQSGSNMPLTRLAQLCALFLFVPLLLAVLFRLPMLVMLPVALLSGLQPYLWMLRKRGKRLSKLDEQLPEVLELMSRALRAGHALPSALQMVSTEGVEPIANEFRITHEEINYGVAAHDALLNMAARVPTTDMRYFVVAVLLQRDTGGNLSELLDNLSKLMRDRFKLLGRIRVLSAEGKLSGYILFGLPFVTAGMINLVNPDFMKVLWTDPIGLKLVGGAFVMMTVGGFWMRKIVRIRV